LITSFENSGRSALKPTISHSKIPEDYRLKNEFVFDTAAAVSDISPACNELCEWNVGD
jgi:hypothetical protein